MSQDLACHRLADVRLPLLDGGSTNLGNFIGQKLVVFFCPVENPIASSQEVEAYRALASEFEKVGTWIVGIVSEPIAPAHRDAEPHVSLGVDADGSAFEKLVQSLPPGVQIDRRGGSAFLIDRDGSIRTASSGFGHAQQMLADARERP